MTDIYSIIGKHALNTPEAPAVVLPGRPPLTYARLYNAILNTGEFLTGCGLKINDRAAVVLPDGMDMACAFFAVSNIATFIPLNHNYSEDEFKYYMSLLKVKFLIVPEDWKDHASMGVAGELGVKIIKPSIQGMADKKAVHKPVYPTANNNDIAILSYTSGTTAKPKIILKSHANQFTSAQQTIRVYSMTTDDRSLIITPMFRGVSIGTLLVSVLSGGSAICLGHYKPAEFFSVLKEFSPTWFLAGPAVLQSIADYAEKNDLPVKGSSLRFIRSSGAPLSPKLSERLKRIFDIPVVISYGMTEAGNVACNYLAPKGHKEGSVGVKMGYDIEIMGKNGDLLPSGTSGEIVVRGPHVVTGYEDNPEANEKAFSNGWFRTGDQGYLDEDGYLFITGRIKELINRGGEKVSPYEVEDAILKHPDVLETAVFPVPYSRFGEDVAAMVVLRPGADLSLRQLRNFLKGKTSYFKMPTRLYAVNEIPKGPAGKVQRKKLHQQLADIGADSISSYLPSEEIAAPANETEEKLIAIWKDILKIDKIGVKDNFFDLGGDSLLVAVLFADIEEAWGRKIPLSIIFEKGTVEHLAESIDSGLSVEAKSGTRPFLVPIQVEGGRTPLFCIHAKDGEVLSYWYLSLHLGADQPVYGLRFNPQGLGDMHPLNITSMAERYIRDIRSVQPQGPYYLAGHSGGGVIALEIARKLKEEGQEIHLLAMLDSKAQKRGDSFADVLKRNRKEICEADTREFVALMCRKVKDKLKKYKQSAQYYTYLCAPDSFKPAVARFMDKEVLIMCSSRNYQLRPYNGDIVFFLPEEHYLSSSASLDRWSELVGGLRVINTPGDHHHMILEPHVRTLAAEMKQCISGAASG